MSKNKTLYILLCLVFYSCSSPKKESSSTDQNNVNSINSINDNEIQHSEFVTKSFILNENIKIDFLFDPISEILHFEIIDSTGPDNIKIQRFSNYESEFGSNNPRLVDFNSDGLLDLLIDYGTGARGSNQFYYLFIRNVQTFQFELIEESAKIPNLYFNEERNVIEGTYFYDGVSFVDFRLENDQLIKTAGIDAWDNNGWTFHEKYQFDKTGNKINVERDSIMDNYESLYSRY